MQNRNTGKILAAIVIGQFFGTSVWFGGNAALLSLQSTSNWTDSAVAFVTSSTQLGFIAGTLIFALWGFTDKYSPAKVFFISASFAAIFNILPLINDSYSLLVVSRLGVGFCLAGIYPVGMKISADWSESGLGSWLGALVGALVLGTSIPHVLQIFSTEIAYNIGFIIPSILCLLGGITMLVFAGDEPYRKAGNRFSFSAVSGMFADRNFRASAFGYFGHMWELYTFWAFIPFFITLHFHHNQIVESPSLLSFITIGAGAIGCVIGGIISRKISKGKIAFWNLFVSGICCILSPIIISLPTPLFVIFLLIWGFAVVADSPQFSALTAEFALKEIRGSALTLVTCIGFAITIVSIQLLALLKDDFNEYIFLFLAPGPLFGIWSCWSLIKKRG